MKQALIILSITLAITSCKPKQEISETHSSTEQKANTQPAVILQRLKVNEMVDMKNTGDPYTIEKADISGDTLILRLSFGGGCEKHEFELLNNFAFKENINEFGRVENYQTRITLKHNAHNDRCRSIVREEKRFDLTPIQQNGTVKVRMKLSGWENESVYQYTLQKH